MTPQLARAQVLIEQQRYAQAIGELHVHLGAQTDDAVAHALLAQCHLQLEHYDEAQRHAEQVIHLAPDAALGFRMLAAVFVRRNRFPEAERAIETALAMDPDDADLFALQAVVRVRQQRWAEAVAAADAGLRIDPEHLDCLNVRAQAQVMLGDRAGAAVTVQDALRNHPDDPWIHANQGWADLHANEPRKAAEHFREALRLDPEMEFARAGIIEALKARNFLYRGMLSYFLFMSRLPSQARWGIVIGLYLAQRFLSTAARQNPDFAPYLWPILGVIVCFAILSWLSYPLFNLLLRLDSFGRHALSTDQRRGANLLGGTLLVAVLSLAAFFATGLAPLFWLALVFGVLALPISAIYTIDAGWPRNVMFACTGVLLLLGMTLLIPDSWVTDQASAEQLRSAHSFFFYGVVGSQFLANYLNGVEVRK